MRKENTLSFLPDDVWRLVLLKLSATDLNHFLLTCKCAATIWQKNNFPNQYAHNELGKIPIYPRLITSTEKKEPIEIYKTLRAQSFTLYMTSNIPAANEKRRQRVDYKNERGTKLELKLKDLTKGQIVSYDNDGFVYIGQPLLATNSNY